MEALHTLISSITSATFIQEVSKIQTVTEILTYYQVKLRDEHDLTHFLKLLPASHQAALYDAVYYSSWGKADVNSKLKVFPAHPVVKHC